MNIEWGFGDLFWSHRTSSWCAISPLAWWITGVTPQRRFLLLMVPSWSTAQGFIDPTFSWSLQMRRIILSTWQRRCSWQKSRRNRSKPRLPATVSSNMAGWEIAMTDHWKASNYCWGDFPASSVWLPGRLDSGTHKFLGHVVWSRIPPLRYFQFFPQLHQNRSVRFCVRFCESWYTPIHSISML